MADRQSQAIQEEREKGQGDRRRRREEPGVTAKRLKREKDKMAGL